LLASVSAVSDVDDMNIADWQSANAGEVEKSTIMLIAH
jgi:hypothetical protein